MDHYVGLDVSLEQTSVRVVDGDGKTLWRSKCASNPEAPAPARPARAPAPAVRRRAARRRAGAPAPPPRGAARRGHSRQGAGRGADRAGERPIVELALA